MELRIPSVKVKEADVTQAELPDEVGDFIYDCIASSFHKSLSSLVNASPGW